MSRGVDNLYGYTSERDFFPVFALPDFETVDSSCGVNSHNDGDLKLSMSGQIVSVIMSQTNKPECRLPLGNEFSIGLDIEDGINKEGLPI
jgi:hypothetical protein